MKEYRRISALGLFDAAYYVEANSDVRSAGIDPLFHFLASGRHERRSPARDVTPEEFFEIVAEVEADHAHLPAKDRTIKALRERRREMANVRQFDLLAARLGPFDEGTLRSRRGEFDVIRSSRHFDQAHYRSQVPELGSNPAEAIAHYVLKGAGQGLEPAPWFNSADFMKWNGEGLPEGANPFAHFLSIMKSGASVTLMRPEAGNSTDPGSGNTENADYSDEWRLISDSGLFDFSWYHVAYLAGNGADDQMDPLTHYLSEGAANGYLPNTWFDSMAFFKECDQPAGTRTPLAGYILTHRRWLDDVNALGHHPRGLSAFADAMLKSGIYSERYYKQRLDEYSLIEASGHFDEALYLSINTDIVDQGWKTGLAHYVAKGAQEGRWPNRWFNPQRFAQENQDMPRGGNPLVAFIALQNALRRQLDNELEGGIDAVASDFLADLPKSGTLSASHLQQLVADYAVIRNRHVFDVHLYTRLNQDVDFTRTAPLNHFVLSGASEGRWPAEWFDIRQYLNENPGLDPRYRNPFADYLRKNRSIADTALQDMAEKDVLDEWKGAIVASGLFDSAFYAGQIKVDAKTPAASLVDHYLRFGRIYGLRPRADFDPKFYRSVYPDCAAAKVEPFVHYVSVGAAENRLTEQPGHEDHAEIHTQRFMKPGTQLRSYEEPRPVSGEPRVRAFAWYLPQFHPVPENDRWWGKGFTEWRNTSRAVPLYPDHVQPRIPADLGYYDLRLPEVMQAQADLARQFGFEGFAVYYYWFAGHRLLERPLDMLLENPQINLPFFLCWANENWTRRWDGAESEILMQQEHSAEDDLALFADVSRYIADKRYVRVEGKPLFVVYRPGLLPDMAATIARWREAARQSGVGEIMIGAVISFGYADAGRDGFDLEIEFPPHNLNNLKQLTHEVMGDNEAFAGSVFSYDSYAEETMKQRYDGRCPVVRGVMPQWDNTARRGNSATIFHGASPAKFQRLFEQIVSSVAAAPETMKPMVIVNAWNEWAEGTYMEPDASWGHAYINAAKRALTGRRYGRIAILGDRDGRETSQWCEVDWIDVMSPHDTDNGEEGRGPRTFIETVLRRGDHLLSYDLIVFGTLAASVTTIDEAGQLAHSFYIDEGLGAVLNETASGMADGPKDDAILYAELAAQTGLDFVNLPASHRAARPFSGIAVRSGVLRPFIRKAPSVEAQWFGDPLRIGFLDASISGAVHAAGFTVERRGGQQSAPSVATAGKMT